MGVHERRPVVAARNVASQAVQVPGLCHEWAWLTSCWQCLACCKLSMVSRPKPGKCQGYNPLFRLVLSERGKLGHCLALLDFDAGPVLLCIKCGHYTARLRAPRLLEKCPGTPGRSRRLELRRAMSGLHPRLEVDRCWQRMFMIDQLELVLSGEQHDTARWGC
eukprot:11225361-Lingulodinium_polyedra.AAC.1